jgi:ketosteroid isomerase-like protein
MDSVRSLYEAFGRGDIPAVLELLSEDVRWEHWADSFAQREGVPWLEPRTGRDGVAEFFRIVGEFEITEFSVLDLMAGESQVVAEIVIDARTPAGGHYRDEELHLWGFDADGKINRMRHYVDTAKHIAAAGDEDTALALTATHRVT